MDADAFNDHCKELVPKLHAGDNNARENLAKITLKYADIMSGLTLHYHPPHRSDFGAEDVAEMSATRFIQAAEKPGAKINNYAGYLSQVVYSVFRRMQEKWHDEIAKSHLPLKEDDTEKRWLAAIEPHSFAGMVDDAQREHNNSPWDEDHEKYLRAAISQLDDLHAPLAEIYYFEKDYMKEAHLKFPGMPRGTLKRTTSEMKDEILGILNQIRDEYHGGHRPADAEVVQETIHAVLRIIEKRSGKEISPS